MWTYTGWLGYIMVETLILKTSYIDGSSSRYMRTLHSPEFKDVKLNVWLNSSSCAFTTLGCESLMLILIPSIFFAKTWAFSF